MELAQSCGANFMDVRAFLGLERSPRQQWGNSRQSKGRHGMGYLRNLGLAAGGVLGMLAIANIAVDPFGAFGVPTRAGFNQNKVSLDDFARFGKPLHILYQEPASLVIGSSRVRSGIDPADMAELGAPVYNYGVPLVSMREIERLIRHAVEEAPVGHVVFGLDFYQFNDTEPFRAGFEEDVFRGWYSPRTFFRAALSYTATVQMLLTLEANRADPDLVGYRLDGFQIVDENPPEEAVGFAMNNIRLFLRRPYLYGEMRSMEDSLETFDRLLSDLRRDGIETTVFLSPMHAMMHETVRELGLGPMYRSWMRAVAEIGAETGTPVWDFSGYNPITTIPLSGLSEHYYDAHHYKPHIGRRMLRIMRGREPAAPGAGGFGVALTPDTVEAQLAAAEMARGWYVAALPDDRERVLRHLASLETELGLSLMPAAAEPEPRVSGDGLPAAPGEGNVAAMR